MKKYFHLLRVKHYIKNLLVILPVFFNKTLFDEKLCILFWGGVSFCLISSAVYIINDINDLEKDRNHPTKKNRPIAKGDISVTKAIVIAIFCIIVSISVSVIIGKIAASIFILLYLIMNILYSRGLKDVAIMDVFILASGFIIRILYGAYITQVEVSNWLFLTIWAGAFYMGLGKRRNEYKLQSEEGETRKVLRAYTYTFLDKNMYACYTMTMIFYALWALEQNDSLYLYTIPMVMLLMMKYSLAIEGASDGDPVEVIYRDKGLIFILIIIALSLTGILYL